MKEKYDPIDQFNSLLVEYMNTFNLLEGNVGSCIVFLEDSSREDSFQSLAKANCVKKIEKLYKIVHLNNLLKSAKRLSELEKWCKNANQMRHRRNYYIHGVWSYIPHLDRVELNVAPWFRQGYDGSTKMTLQDFKVVVQEIKDCFHKLLEIRAKNGI
ncbi:MAG: hypothetical protein V7739_08910 [Motiliproteus sp.]